MSARRRRLRAAARSRVGSWARALGRRGRLDAEMEEEMRFHIDSRAADLEREGVPAREAARRARVEFGGAATHKDAARRVLGVRWLDELAADLRYAVRLLAKSPGFTVIAVGSLALAIGANTTVFSAANEMLYARLGVPRAGELRLLVHEDDGHSPIHQSWGSFNNSVNGKMRGDAFTYPVYQELRRSGHGLRRVLAVKDLFSTNVTVDGSAESVEAQLVSGDFYGEMEIRPVLGRAILPADDGAPGSGAVAVISYGFWQRAFGGSRDVIGKTMRVDTVAVTVVGVNPRNFTGATDVQRSPAIFLPLSMISALVPSLGKERLPDSPKLAWLTLMGRAAPGVSDAAAESALDVTFNAAMRATMPVAKDETIPRLIVDDGSRGLHWSDEELRQPIYVLLGMVGFVLLLACANVANLMLARATARQREMSVRLALGAGRRRIFRQLLTESLLLAGLGGGGGLLLGYLGRNVLPRMLESSWTRNDLNVPFDWKVFSFTAGVTLLTGVLFGLAPAWRASRHDVNTALKEGAQSASRRRRAWSGKLIVGFQVALSTLLVIGCALFVRTVLNLNRIDPGFRPWGVLLFGINPPNAKYPGGRSVALHDRLQEVIAALPGVGAVSVTDTPFMANYDSDDSVRVEGTHEVHREPGDTRDFANTTTVGSNFFEVMKIPLLAGRSFTAQDSEHAPEVAVVNQAFVRKFFPGANPIGKRFTTHSDAKGTVWTEVIGICADTRYAHLKEPPPPIHFEVYRQIDTTSRNALGMAYLVRTELKPETLVPALRRAVAGVDSDLPLMEVRTYVQQIEANTQQERTFASLSAGFAVLALLLAAVGVYGIMAYTVAQRTNEIGIRLALGAERRAVRGMVLRETSGLALGGVVAGLGAALLLVRLVKSMLFGLTPTDPTSLGAGACLLVAMALVAGWVPAVRAARIEPMEALRHE